MYFLVFYLFVCLFSIFLLLTLKVVKVSNHFPFLWLLWCLMTNEHLFILSLREPFSLVLCFWPANSLNKTSWNVVS